MNKIKDSSIRRSVEMLITSELWSMNFNMSILPRFSVRRLEDYIETYKDLLLLADICDIKVFGSDRSWPCNVRYKQELNDYISIFETEIAKRRQEECSDGKA